MVKPFKSDKKWQKLSIMLDAVEIVMELEHELDIYIPDDKMQEIYYNASYTVKDVYDAVEELMQ